MYDVEGKNNQWEENLFRLVNAGILKRNETSKSLILGSFLLRDRRRSNTRNPTPVNLCWGPMQEKFNKTPAYIKTRLKDSEQSSHSLLSSRLSR